MPSSVIATGICARSASSQHFVHRAALEDAVAGEDHRPLRLREQLVRRAIDVASRRSESDRFSGPLRGDG